MEKNIGEYLSRKSTEVIAIIGAGRRQKRAIAYLSRKSTEVIAIVACIGLIITIILAAGSIRTEQEKAHMVLHSSCLQTK